MQSPHIQRVCESVSAHHKHSGSVPQMLQHPRHRHRVKVESPYHQAQRQDRKVLCDFPRPAVSKSADKRTKESCATMNEKRRSRKGADAQPREHHRQPRKKESVRRTEGHENPRHGSLHRRPRVKRRQLFLRHKPHRQVIELRVAGAEGAGGGAHREGVVAVVLVQPHLGAHTERKCPAANKPKSHIVRTKQLDQEMDMDIDERKKAAGSSLQPAPQVEIASGLWVCDAAVAGVVGDEGHLLQRQTDRDPANH